MPSNCFVFVELLRESVCVCIRDEHEERHHHHRQCEIKMRTEDSTPLISRRRQRRQFECESREQLDERGAVFQRKICVYTYSFSVRGKMFAVTNYNGTAKIFY